MTEKQNKYANRLVLASSFARIVVKGKEKSNGSDVDMTK